MIDIYNSLTIHGLAMCEGGLPNSVLEIKNFWRRTSYKIGSFTFSLDDIEHGILRGMRDFVNKLYKQFLFTHVNNIEGKILNSDWFRQGI